MTRSEATFGGSFQYTMIEHMQPAQSARIGSGPWMINVTVSWLAGRTHRTMS
jgi:hypothetical protein